MTTAIDSNVFVALWDENPAVSSPARRALESALQKGRLILCGAVYGELLAGPGRAAEFLDVFLNQAGVAVDWETSQELWTVAGTAFHRYAMRRRSHRDAGPRRLLADFIIGAHALLQADRLLTFDTRVYRTAFPPLVVISA